MKLELIHVGLLVKLAGDYTTRGTYKCQRVGQETVYASLNLYIPVVPTPGQLGLANSLAEPLPCKYINNAISANQSLIQLQKGRNSYLERALIRFKE